MYLKNLLIVLLSLALFFSFSSFAQGTKVELEPPIASKSFGDLMGKFIDFLFYATLLVSPAVIAYAGFLVITASGDPEKVKEAYRLIFYVVIGLAIIFSAKGIIGLVEGTFGIGGGL